MYIFSKPAAFSGDGGIFFHGGGEVSYLLIHFIIGIGERIVRQSIVIIVEISAFIGADGDGRFFLRFSVITSLNTKGLGKRLCIIGGQVCVEILRDSTAAIGEGIFKSFFELLRDNKGQSQGYK